MTSPRCTVSDLGGVCSESTDLSMDTRPDIDGDPVVIDVDDDSEDDTSVAIIDDELNVLEDGELADSESSSCNIPIPPHGALFTIDTTGNIQVGIDSDWSVSTSTRAELAEQDPKPSSSGGMSKTKCNISYELTSSVPLTPNTPNEQVRKKFDAVGAVDEDIIEVDAGEATVSCFNCGGNHHMKHCKQPRRFARIARNRRAWTKSGASSGRYHTHQVTKPGGCLSSELREALGLVDGELPLHIYRMRTLGYPPGYKQSLITKKSSIRFLGAQARDDSTQSPSATAAYHVDHQGVIEYPGYNCPLPPGFIDGHRGYDAPPYSEQQSIAKFISQLTKEVDALGKRESSISGDKIGGLDVDKERSSVELVDESIPNEPPAIDDFGHAEVNYGGQNFPNHAFGATQHQPCDFDDFGEPPPRVNPGYLDDRGRPIREYDTDVRSPWCGESSAFLRPQPSSTFVSEAVTDDYPTILRLRYDLRDARENLKHTKITMEMEINRLDKVNKDLSQKNEMLVNLLREYQSQAARKRKKKRSRSRSPSPSIMDGWCVQPFETGGDFCWYNKASSAKKQKVDNGNVDQMTIVNVEDARDDEVEVIEVERRSETDEPITPISAFLLPPSSVLPSTLACSSSSIAKESILLDERVHVVELGNNCEDDDDDDVVFLHEIPKGTNEPPIIIDVDSASEKSERTTESQVPEVSQHPQDNHSPAPAPVTTVNANEIQDEESIIKEWLDSILNAVEDMMELTSNELLSSAITTNEDPDADGTSSSTVEIDETFELEILDPEETSSFVVLPPLENFSKGLLTEATEEVEVELCGPSQRSLKLNDIRANIRAVRMRKAKGETSSRKESIYK